ncbi:hypothetical protein GCM10025880_38600 [Methylorubrum aminovorans]|nr:hypothetical protein GCM10025880_38600 [Methylorubrum aminovorans]
MRAYLGEVVQGRDHRAALAVPAADQCEQVGGGALVDAGEGLIEQDDPRVLQDQPGEQRPLELPAGEGADRPVLEAGEPDRRERVDQVRALAGEAAPRTERAPQAHRHEVEDAQGEAAVDLGGLRQVGDGAGPRFRLDRPVEGRISPTMPFRRVDLPAPFGPTTASRSPAAMVPSR